jgi:uncharacterized glyoxalase superfamily protein PhnB
MLANRSIPRCTVIPELAYPDISEAIKWLCDVFGFTLRLGIANHRAQWNVGDGAVVLTSRPPDQNFPPGSGTVRTHSVLVRVQDVDSHHAHAAQRGARILQPPADHPYGERQYNVEDFAGHRWMFSQSIADVAPEGWGGTPGEIS